MTDPNQPTDATSLNRMGIQAIRQGQVARGRSMLEAAVAQQPKNVQFLADLGQVQAMTSQERAAIETFQRCLAVDPGVMPARLNLGILLFRAGRIDEADTCFQEALDASPEEVGALVGIGLVRQRQERLPDAIDALEKAAVRAPQDAEIQTNLGGVLKEAGETARAIACFEKAIELAPKLASLHTRLGELKHEAQSAEAALQHYEDALKLLPNDAHALAVKGAALIAMGRPEEAARIFDHDALVASKQFTAAPGYRDLAAFNRDLAAFASTHPTLEPTPYGKTTRGGGQTGQLVGPKEGPMVALQNMIREAMQEYFGDRTRAQHAYAPRNTGPGRLFAWATVLDRGGYQDPHNHPSGVLSGVYYVQLPEDDGEAGAIEFGRPPPKFCASAEPDVALIRPKPGLMVLFPSFYWHRTIPFEGDGKRISIAFDLIIGR